MGGCSVRGQRCSDFEGDQVWSELKLLHIDGTLIEINCAFFGTVIGLFAENTPCKNLTENLMGEEVVIGDKVMGEEVAIGGDKVMGEEVVIGDKVMGEEVGEEVAIGDKVAVVGTVLVGGQVLVGGEVVKVGGSTEVGGVVIGGRVEAASVCSSMS
jgi:UDP-3-O-[3-hydroxymyristoyl] glucosamine N-acyltransferase